jgi:ABC-type antimicrobial peptide transport system permease subunit
MRQVRLPFANETERKEVRFNIIDTNYFRVLGIQLLRGRHFEHFDSREGQKVVVINETLSKEIWPGQDAIDKMILIGDKQEPYRVIGLVRNTTINTLTDKEEPYLYLYYVQQPCRDATLLIETLGDPARPMPSAKATLAQLDGDIVITGVTTMDRLFRVAVHDRIVSMLIVGSLAAVGVILAVLGLYGTVVHQVKRRRVEVAVRLALGATPSHIVRLVMLSVLRTALLGVVGGTACALATAKWMEALFHGQDPHNAAIFFSVAISLLAVAAIAAYIPARSSVVCDPAVYLRGS